MLHALARRGADYERLIRRSCSGSSSLDVRGLTHQKEKPP